jgi:heat shock protein HtpX
MNQLNKIKTLDKLKSNKIENLFQSAGIILLMGFTLWLSAYFILGQGALLYLLTGMALFFLIFPGSSKGLTLRGGREITYTEAPQIFDIMERLSRKAGLNTVPRLLLVNRTEMNAFTFGSRTAPVIAVTAPMVRSLNSREFEGMLAHEIGHIKNGDLFLLSLARNTEIMTSFLSRLGFFLLLFNLPILLFGGSLISFWGILFLIFAPGISKRLWFALSRTREFQADAVGAELIGDPGAMVDLLKKLRSPRFSFFGYVFTPSRETGPYSTHPDPEERIKRLKTLLPEKNMNWFYGV